MNDGLTSRLPTRIVFEDLVAVNFALLSAEESATVLRMRNAPEVRTWMTTSRLVSQHEHSRFMKGRRNDASNQYFLVKRVDEILGVVSLKRIDMMNRHAYLGIYRNPDLAETGIGARLMEVLGHIAFDVLGLHGLRLEVISTNARALALYRRCGFTEEGKLRDYCLKDDTWADMIVMSRLALECPPRGETCRVRH